MRPLRSTVSWGTITAPGTLRRRGSRGEGWAVARWIRVQEPTGKGKWRKAPSHTQTHKSQACLRAGDGITLAYSGAGHYDDNTVAPRWRNAREKSEKVSADGSAARAFLRPDGAAEMRRHSGCPLASPVCHSRLADKNLFLSFHPDAKQSPITPIVILAKLIFGRWFRTDASQCERSLERGGNSLNPIQIGCGMKSDLKVACGLNADLESFKTGADWEGWGRKGEGNDWNSNITGRSRLAYKKNPTSPVWLLKLKPESERGTERQKGGGGWER